MGNNPKKRRLAIVDVEAQSDRPKPEGHARAPNRDSSRGDSGRATPRSWAEWQSRKRPQPDWADAPSVAADADPAAKGVPYTDLLNIAEFSLGSRDDAHYLGAALEAARAAEKRSAKSADQGELDLPHLSLLRKSEQELGPDDRLDVLVPALRNLNQRIVVLEDKEKRVNIFKHWFQNYDFACTKVIREGIDMVREKVADYLFLDFDIHDLGDSALRDWLRVSKKRKELDGLDLAEYVARMPEGTRPKNIIIHSRNPIGRKLLKQFLERKKLNPVMWAFKYNYEGPDASIPPPVVPPPSPPKKYTYSTSASKRFEDKYPDYSKYLIND